MLECVFHHAKVQSVSVHVMALLIMFTVRTLCDVCFCAGSNVFVVSPAYFLNYLHDDIL